MDALRWLLGLSALTMLACGTVAPQAGSSASEGTPNSVVVHQSFSPALIVRQLKLTVGQSLWVTGSDVCTGSQPNETCGVLFVPLGGADENVLKLDRAATVFEGLPAQRFVALNPGKTGLAPAEPCVGATCPSVAVYP